ncbi:hypothetical protein K493DRAFT_319274 [Basidiobolus meristosporus CBS 931.73]|uniref:Uncharacterized protein n=1 Tax=Basidiobolus meristosporus CBS 931.73 TaxID=1314790 RepID=A0A1Y1XTT6_9FUNG|nr:hypothetical protein K493DRAFT_319274 [Basidiobolus meristosporus CBS 931.73]|eukprot:ORX88704.1 hypothetical protein K493DRAFT_319274 [Basidiobolus meristosporus CBS 931.73]
MGGNETNYRNLLHLCRSVRLVQEDDFLRLSEWTDTPLPLHDHSQNHHNSNTSPHPRSHSRGRATSISLQTSGPTFQLTFKANESVEKMESRGFLEGFFSKENAKSPYFDVSQFTQAPPGEENNPLKRKQYRILALWPLPTVTRQIIILSALLSILNLFNLLPTKVCSAPSFVLYRKEYLGLLLSPFLIPLTPVGLLISGLNFLTLGLFEESLSHFLGGTKRFLITFVGLLVGVSAVRQFIGYLFSRGTGWALPILFFSDSLHECSQGMAPFLFSMLVFQSVNLHDKYILYYGEEIDTRIKVSKVWIQLFMCMLNFLPKNAFWWSISGLLVGFVATIGSYSVMKRQKIMRQMPSISKCYFSVPIKQLVVKAIKRCSFVLGIAAVLLLFCNVIYTRPVQVDPETLTSISEDRYLMTFLVMTAPRPGQPDFLTNTIESYLAHFPAEPALESFYSRVQMVVYTHFDDHPAFERAKMKFENTRKGQRYLRWVQEPGSEKNQHLHFSKAMKLVSETYQTSYIEIVEDDFPLCENTWPDFLRVLYHANKHVPEHCGAFVGTGGSGLIFKRHIAEKAHQLLLSSSQTPPDIILQNCLLGVDPQCQECSQTLVISKSLLMHHIGYNTSTSDTRSYNADEFQCGWRHPFNGEQSTIVV